MTIRALLDSRSPLFSFEYFPPKTSEGEARLFETISRMRDLDPGFVSVTCGAGGSTKTKTVDWAQRIKAETGIEAVVHMTCYGMMRDELRETVSQVKRSGLENILALRGDKPKNDPGFAMPDGGCQYAIDLIRVVREEYPAACVLGACYPEGHLDAASREVDLLRLKEKCDAGLDVLVTQLFFDNGHYFRFVEDARRVGVTQPIIPGIMPVTNVVQVEKFVKMCGATMPLALVERLRSCHDEQEVLAVGVEHAVTQCKGLITGGAPGIHFYTLNRTPATRLVVQGLR